VDIKIETGPVPAPRRIVGPCRVEHRTVKGVAVLHAGGVHYAHHRALEPYASYLALGGVSDGDLVLIDEATGAVLARRRVAPRRRRGTGA